MLGARSHPRAYIAIVGCSAEPARRGFAFRSFRSTRWKASAISLDKGLAIGVWHPTVANAGARCLARGIYIASASAERPPLLRLLLPILYVLLGWENPSAAGCRMPLHKRFEGISAVLDGGCLKDAIACGHRRAGTNEASVKPAKPGVDGQGIRESRSCRCCPMNSMIKMTTNEEMRTRKAKGRRQAGRYARWNLFAF